MLIEKKIDRTFKLLAKSLKNLANISDFYPDSKVLRKFLIEQYEANFDYLNYEDYQTMLRMEKLNDPENYLPREKKVCYYFSIIFVIIDS